MEKKNTIHNVSLSLHRERRGKIATLSTFKIRNKKEYRYAMSPGVASVAKRISQLGVQGAYRYTIKSHTVAFITDGSAVLGLGNLGPYSGITIVEGKAALLKEFTGIDGIPISLATQDNQEIIKTIRNIAPIFGAINLEDIAAPRCFEIEESLSDLGIPVFHDDQHGAAIVVYSALLNSCRAINKKLSELSVVVCGAGAAGSAISRMLLGLDNEFKGLQGLSWPVVRNVVVVDSKGIVEEGRKDLDKYKKMLSSVTNKAKCKGGLKEALVGADVFIGVSSAGVLKRNYISLMAENPIIFAMANPVPEIGMALATQCGVRIYGSGRGDGKIHINNMLAFPGIFKGLLEMHVEKFDPLMKYQAAIAISKMVENPSEERLLPNPFREDVAGVVSKAIKRKGGL